MHVGKTGAVVTLVGGFMLFATEQLLHAPLEGYAIICGIALFVGAALISAVVAVILTKEKAEPEAEALLSSCRTTSQVISGTSESIKTRLIELEKTIPVLDISVKKIEKSAETMQKVLNLEEIGHQVITADDMQALEANVASGKEIWILTSALELEEGQLSNVIRNNFKKNITYRYFLPIEDKVLLERFERMANDWKKDCELSQEEASAHIKCYLVPNHFTYMTVVIFNPYGKKPTVLVKFPASDVYPSRKYPLIFQVSNDPPEAAGVFVKALQDFVSGTCAKGSIYGCSFV